jgi:hypothetical protein
MSFIGNFEASAIGGGATPSCSSTPNHNESQSESTPNSTRLSKALNIAHTMPTSSKFGSAASFIRQASNKSERNGIGVANVLKPHQQQQYHQKSRANSNTAETMMFLRELSAIAGNEKCADCGSNDTKWASINLGVSGIYLKKLCS